MRVIKVDWLLLGGYVQKTYSSLKWPAVVLITAFILTPKYWPAHVHYSSQLVLSYIDVLKWPVVVLVVTAVVRPYLPDLFNRLREFGAGPFKGRLAPPSSQQSDTQQIKELAKEENVPEPAQEIAPSQDLETLLTSPEAKLAFEQVYNSIFGTQLTLLKRLVANIPNGLSAEQLNDIYQAHVAGTPNPYPSFVAFVQYLIDNTLVLYDVETGLYHLTNAGVYFLNYLRESGKYETFRAF